MTQHVASRRHDPAPPLRDKPVDFTKVDEGRWYFRVVRAPQFAHGAAEAAQLCEANWEPFAVDDGDVWFRKRY